MILKTTEIHLRPHVKRYIEATYKINGGSFKVKSHVTLISTNDWKTAKNYITNPRNHTATIKVEMYYPSEARRYALMRFLTQLFNIAFYAYVSAEVERGEAAMQAVTKFLYKYGITEEEYSIDSAYKKWQRYKENTPLC